MQKTFDARLKELLEEAKLKKGDLLVVGCSTSEVGGATIGTFSSPELAEMVFGGIYQATEEAGVYLVAQCCEHLNRALILERAAAEKYGDESVIVIPQPKAGGSVPAAAWKLLDEPVLAISVQADAAIDVGDTLVGMHIRPVAVPLRPEIATLGDARIVMAYSRWPLIGGERAVYKE